MKLILPESMDAPTIPEYFLRGLKDIDSGLVIYWNRFRNRFVVDRCTRAEPHTHGVSCERANVLIVEDDEKQFMMPCQWTLDKIKAMDAWTNYGTLENQRLARENAKADWDAKQKEKTKEEYRDAMLDDKRQLLRAIDLIQRHDVARPNK